MHRRDFLLLRTRPKSREFELSGQWIYFKCLDAPVGGTAPDAGEAPGLPQYGEPPASFDRRTSREVFDTLDRELRRVDTVRVTNQQWLTGELRWHVGALLRSFRARGGKVYFEP